ncbi:MAG: DUF402 domain-containing protein [Chloroflexota bacterium]|nr:DUF402 domain-containing protein [Chloroflexota bacterium]
MSLSQEIAVTKLDHEGRAVISYPGRVVYADSHVLAVRTVWEDPTPHDLGFFRIRLGDIFVEFYYPHEDFNVMQMYSDAGVLKGWYCNFTMDVEIGAGRIAWQDAVLDLLVLPGGQQVVLDRDEFEALGPSEALRRRADAALRVLQRWAREGHAPFWVL